MFQGFQNNYGGVNPVNPVTPYPQNPYMERLQALQQPQMYPLQNNPQTGLIRVTGIDGAKAYQMGPNSVAALFDANDDVFFVKSTDGAGFPTVRAFRFTPIEQTAPQQSGDFVTRAEFDQLKGMIFNGQQLIREQSPQQPAGSPAAAEQSNGNVTAVPAVSAANGRP